MERICDLQINGLTLLQDDELYCFTSDSVLLADFVRAKTGETVCDFGTGAGIIAILLAGKRPGIRVTACEIQPALCALARRNAERNGLAERVEVREEDLRRLRFSLPKPADAVVCNPPYFRRGSSFVNENESKARARHEIDITLPELCESAAKTLKEGGRFFVSYPADRFCELIAELCAVGLEPKRVRGVQTRADAAPHLFLVESQKGGSRGVQFLPPLILEGEEIKEIYARARKEDE